MKTKVVKVIFLGFFGVAALIAGFYLAIGFQSKTAPTKAQSDEVWKESWSASKIWGTTGTDGRIGSRNTDRFTFGSTDLIAGSLANNITSQVVDWDVRGCFGTNCTLP